MPHPLPASLSASPPSEASCGCREMPTPQLPMPVGTFESPTDPPNGTSQDVPAGSRGAVPASPHSLNDACVACGFVSPLNEPPLSASAGSKYLGGSSWGGRRGNAPIANFEPSQWSCSYASHHDLGLHGQRWASRGRVLAGGLSQGNGPWPEGRSVDAGARTVVSRSAGDHSTRRNQTGLRRDCLHQRRPGRATRPTAAHTRPLDATARTTATAISGAKEGWEPPSAQGRAVRSWA